MCKIWVCFPKECFSCFSRVQLRIFTMSPVWNKTHKPHAHVCGMNSNARGGGGYPESSPDGILIPHSWVNTVASQMSHTLWYLRRINTIHNTKRKEPLFVSYARNRRPRDQLLLPVFWSLRFSVVLQQAKCHDSTVSSTSSMIVQSFAQSAKK